MVSGAAFMSIPNTKPTFVVLAHGEADDRLLAANILMEEGYRVIAAATADQALAVIQARRETQIVVTEANLPGSMNGYGLAHIVDTKWPEIGLIVIGAIPPVCGEMPTRAHFLRKPYAPPSLIRVAQEVLGELPAF